MTLRVTATGPLALIQDLGRPGHARSGVPESGAYDRAALRLANALVGNPAWAPAIECLLGGLRLTVTQTCTLAVTGADVPVTIVGHGQSQAASEIPPQNRDRRAALSLSMREVIRLEPSTSLELGRPRNGLRTYVAVAGGLAAPQVLGSAATDTLSGLGPAPLVPGDRLGIDSQRVDLHPPQPGKLHPLSVPTTVPSVATSIRVQLGPFDDMPRESADSLLGGTWRVSPNSDRVGLRLGSREGAAMRVPALPTRGPTPMFRGVIQLPPSGELIIMGPDAPTTGGYPIIGVVDDADLDCLAQLRPGRSVRFSAG